MNVGVHELLALFDLHCSPIKCEEAETINEWPITLIPSLSFETTRWSSSQLAFTEKLIVYYILYNRL